MLRHGHKLLVPGVLGDPAADERAVWKDLPILLACCGKGRLDKAATESPTREPVIDFRMNKGDLVPETVVLGEARELFIIEDLEAGFGDVIRHAGRQRVLLGSRREPLADSPDACLVWLRRAT
jgi:hypothetical protein